MLSAGTNFGVEPCDRGPLTRGGSDLHNPCKAAWLLALKQQLLERLQEDPGPQERDEIGRLLVLILRRYPVCGEIRAQDAIHR